MSDTTTTKRASAVGGNGKAPSASASVRAGIDELLHDIVSLVELQGQLLAVDAREYVQKVRRPCLIFSVAMLVGLGSGPVLLIALAEGLQEAVGWSRWLSYLTSGGVGIALGVVLALSAWRQVGAASTVFRRSRVEFTDNLRWVKYALTQGRRPRS